MHELEAAIHRLSAGPKDAGQLNRLVSRPEKGSRTVLQTAHFTPEGGLQGLCSGIISTERIFEFEKKKTGNQENSSSGTKWTYEKSLRLF